MIKGRDGNEASDNWATPKWLYHELNDYFHFDFDPCPLFPVMDGLDDTTEWGKRNFVNPPYNRIDKPKFLERAHAEWFYNKKTSAILVPSATGTNIFHELFLPSAHTMSYDFWKLRRDSFILKDINKLILFFKGRLAFGGFNTKGIWTDKNKGKHDSMLIILK